MNKKSFWIGTALMVLTCLNARAANKITVVINHQTISAWRTADLESAKKEAAAAHKPIAWIASDPKVLDGTGKISLNGSPGATLHAFYALRGRTVIVFMDAFAENHKCLPLVDQALHTPNSHYIVPTVVFLNPEATQVLAKVEFEPDFVKRARALADALEQVNKKMNPSPNNANK